MEIIDLDTKERGLLTEDIATASRALKKVTGCYKLNVAALGNQVRSYTCISSPGLKTTRHGPPRYGEEVPANYTNRTPAKR